MDGAPPIQLSTVINHQPYIAKVKDEEGSFIDILADVTQDLFKLSTSAAVGAAGALLLSKAMVISPNDREPATFMAMLTGAAVSMIFSGCKLGSSPLSVSKQLIRAALEGAVYGAAVGVWFGYQSANWQIPNGFTHCTNFYVGTYCPSEILTYRTIVLSNVAAATILGAGTKMLLKGASNLY